MDDKAKEILYAEELRDDIAWRESATMPEAMADAPEWARVIYQQNAAMLRKYNEVLEIAKNIQEVAAPAIDKFSNGPLGKMLGGF